MGLLFTTGFVIAVLFYGCFEMALIYADLGTLAFGNLAQSLAKGGPAPNTLLLTGLT